MELARFSLTTTRCHLGFVYFVQHQETTRADRGVCLVARAALWSLFITIVVANAQMNILKASYSHCNYPSEHTLTHSFPLTHNKGMLSRMCMQNGIYIHVSANTFIGYSKVVIQERPVEFAHLLALPERMQVDGIFPAHFRVLSFF